MVWTRIMAKLTVRRIQLAVYLDMKCSIKSKIDLALHILETDLKKAHNSRIDQDHRNNSAFPVPKKKSGRSMHYLYCLEWWSQTHIDWFEYEPDILTFPWRRTWTFALPGRLVANRLFRRRIRQYYALWWWFVSKILLGKGETKSLGDYQIEHQLLPTISCNSTESVYNLDRILWEYS